MASARFIELLRCRGVDQTATPWPGMVIPFRGENQIVLETGGEDVQVHGGVGLNVQEVDGDLLSRVARDVRDEMSKPNVDPQQRDAFMPTTTWNKPRFFRILGTIKTGFPGTVVKLVPKPTRAKPKPAGVTALQVAVVDRMVVKVAIRNVRARDAQGEMRYHAKRPCNPADEVERMNQIWTPQTNIAFELVPSGDLDVDHNNPKTQEELRKAYGMKTAMTFSPETTVWADKNSAWFAQHRVKGAHITFFVVHKLLSGGNPDNGRGGEIPNGTMNRPTGVSFISDLRLPSTFAHEAGHFIGDMAHSGSDITLLMRGDGAGYKIPFDLAKHFRESLPKRAIQ